MKRFLVMLLTFCAAWSSIATAQNVMPQLGDKISTDNGIYVVSGSNLIPNASFDDGFANWKAGNGSDLSESNFALEASGGADGGAYLRALGSAGSSSEKSIKTGWEVEVGKTYLFSMWANRPSSGMSNNTQYSRIYSANSATGTDEQIGSVNFTGDTWVQTQIVFTAERPYLVANLGWMNQTRVDAFFLGELSLSEELATAALEAAIADGKYQLDNTEEGTERGQYTTDVRATLQAAITAAEAVLASATTQEQINEATSTLKTAISTYKASANAPFKVGTKYNIVHSSGYVMTTTGGTVKIVSEDVDDQGQVFSFVPAPAEAAATGFNLQADDGTFVHRQGSWDTKADADFDLTASNAIFQVVDQGTYIQLKNMGSGSVLGTDSNSDGSSVYSNKNGTDGKNRWTLKEFIPKDQRDDEYNFQQLLAKAQKTLSDVSASSIGDDLFMTSRSAYETFAAAVAAAEAVSSDYKAATATLQAALDVFAANRQVKPDATTKYILTQQAGGNRLAYNAEQTLATVATPSAETTQQFSFVQVEATGNFALQNVGAAKFLAKSANSNWDTNWADDSSDLLAQWIVARQSDGTYTLQNASGKGYLGSDATADGSLLYCDKSSSAANSRWVIEEYTPTATLAKTIAQAKALADATAVGTAYYEVPQQAMDDLRAAIATAEAALATVTTFEEGAAAATALQQAIDTFEGSFNPLQSFDEGVTYTIAHQGGALLTATDSGSASITAEAEGGASEEQLVTFEPVEGAEQTYYIRSVALETYFARTGDYDTKWQAEKNEAAQVKVVQLDGRWLGLQFATGLHAGTDATTSGSLVYSDKSGKGNSLAYWFIDTYVTVVLDREAFNAALEAANTLLAEMTPGYLTGQYFQEDINAFRQLIASTRSAALKAKDQTTLDAITAQLLTDTETARAKVHDHDYMNHTILAAAIAAAEKTLQTAVAGDLNGQYPASAITDYQTALTAAKTVNETADDQLTQALIDEAATALQTAAQTFANQMVRIDYTSLNEQIATAQKALKDAEADKGEGAGKIPASAFEALQNEVATAQAMVKGHTHNQAGVDSETQTLSDAITTFLATRAENDYSLLQQYVDEAEKLLAQYADGTITCSEEDAEYLRASLEKNAAYLYSTNQDDIDRAAKLLRRDVLLFQGIVNAITSPTSQGSTSYYTLDGRRLSHPAKGLLLQRQTIGQKAITRRIIIK